MIVKNRKAVKAVKALLVKVFWVHSAFILRVGLRSGGDTKRHTTKKRRTRRHAFLGFVFRLLNFSMNRLL